MTSRELKWNTRCRFFDEKYACDTLTTEGYDSCEQCIFCEEIEKKILVIKFGALGDIIRTTPILEAIKKKYGSNTLIYWLTVKEAEPLLENNPLIDKILIYGLENILRIQQERFDVLFSLEINTPATLIAGLVNAYEKYGYYFNNGSTHCFNSQANEYLETAFLNTKKLNNRKTYQELIFNAANLEYNKEFLIMKIHENKKQYADEFRKKNNISENDKLIGIHIGADSRWPSKCWSNEKIKEFVKAVDEEYKVLLFGGPNEKEKIQKLSQNLNVLTNNPNNSYSEFAAVLNICNLIITHDTFPLHMAIALKKPTIALFFCTPDWEIEDYNLNNIKKIVSPLLQKYFFTNQYVEELVNSISVDQVVNSLREVE